MTEFKTPIMKKCRSRLEDNPELLTPLKIPPSPFLEKIGYGCGVTVFTLERSPKVGFVRSPWAIKKVNRRIMNNEKYNDRIRLEAKVLRELDHPNIVGFRAVTNTLNGDLCLAMEKLEISLGDMIEKRLEDADEPFPARDILKVACEIAKGLEYLHHTVHILHGDVKSYNVLVSNNYNVVKLCDFGVSVPLTKTLQIDRSNGNFWYVGTESWSAPEVIQDSDLITNKADIWAYGLTLWEMIALCPPHCENCDDSADENSDDSLIFGHITDHKENKDPNLSMDDSVVLCEEIPDVKYGTRPPLPAIHLGPEYQKVLELFYACTDLDYELRPSAKGIVMFFKKYVNSESKELSKESTSRMDCDA